MKSRCGLIDDYDRANREYKMRFGDQLKLRHALPQAVKDKRVGA